MIRKIGVLGISLLCFAAITSCEKDFSEVGTNVVNNTKFETGEILLDVEINPINIERVQADNINATIGEYWLGVYNNPNAKKIESSIISQVGLVSDRKFIDKEYASTDVVSSPVLDGVILKIPLAATLDGKHSNKSPKFKLDNLLGDKSKEISIKVFQSETFLNRDNPTDPTKTNSFYSDHMYSQGVQLGSSNTFSYNLDESAVKDTVFYFNRTVLANTTRTYKDSIKIANGNTITANPFKYIELDKSFFQTNFIDKYETEDFATQNAFIEKVLKAIIIVAEGSDGAAVPLNFSNAILRPSIDLLLTTTVKDENNKVIDSIGKIHSYPLSGISNSIYKMTPATNAAPANNFSIQGTAGALAEIKILDDTKLQELREQNLLINDASLTFYINQAINPDKDIIPQQLFIYQNKENESGGISPTQLVDAYTESATFGGYLILNDDAPEKYTFRITDYISKLLSGENDITADPLVLKVYNPTDVPVNSQGALDTNVKTYNWNPRSVMLLDGNESTNGGKRAVLKISYSKEK